MPTTWPKMDDPQYYGLEDVWPASEDDCESPCAVCGDDFEEGDDLINVPAYGWTPERRMIQTAHLGCAVRGREVKLPWHG